MSGIEILQLIGCCLCAAYTITFVMMGWALGVEVWHDRKRELLFPCQQFAPSPRLRFSLLPQFLLHIYAIFYCHYNSMPCAITQGIFIVIL